MKNLIKKKEGRKTGREERKRKKWNENIKKEINKQAKRCRMKNNINE